MCYNEKMLVQTAKDNGYIAAHNHPVWSLEPHENIMAYEGFFSMEMCNYGSYVLNRLEYNAALYDKLLNSGKRIFCHSTDDNHNMAPVDSPNYDSFGAFTMVMPEEFSYDGIINAMENGEMYSSMGPIFKEISLDGNKLHVECSDVFVIMVFTGGKMAKRQYAEPGKTVNCADFELDENTRFVRVSVMDEKGRYADTRGFFRDELGL